MVEDSEEEKEPPKKRGRQSQSKAASSKRDHSESMDVDEAPPPKKKTKTPATKKRNPSPDEEDEAEETTVHDHSVDVLKKYMKFKDWTDIIEKIDTVEGTGDDLLCYFTTCVIYFSSRNSCLTFSVYIVKRVKRQLRLQTSYENEHQTR